jgi:DNA-binding GntR family transcriptional regulator
LKQALVYQSLAQQVAQEIRRQIEFGVLKPKQRLTEVGLAAQLGISRAPVREALRSLAEQGLVVYVARRGYLVGWLTPKSLRDTYSTRQALECLAIQQVAQTNTPGLLGKLADSIRKMEDATKSHNVQAVIKSDLAFHYQLVVASGNEVLHSVYRLITNPLVPALNILVPYELAELTAHDAEHHYVDEHRAVLAALQRRDPEEASRLLTEHLDRAMKNLQALIARDSKANGDSPSGAKPSWGI